MLAICAALVSSPSMPGGARDADWRQAVDRLDREKVLAKLRVNPQDLRR
jgi:hypothetical protein